MANIVMDSTWIRTVQHVHATGDEVIHANVSRTYLSTAAAIKEVIPVARPQLTLPAMTHKFAHDPELALRHRARQNRTDGPYTYVWPNSAQATLIEADPSVPVLSNEFLVPPVQHLDSLLRRLVTSIEEATMIIPQWTNDSWYATAVRACFEYKGHYQQMLGIRFPHNGPCWPATSSIAMMTNRKNGKWIRTCQTTNNHKTKKHQHLISVSPRH